MKIIILVNILFFSLLLPAREIMCELKGTYETTYGVPNRNYLKDFGDALKTFTAGPYTGFFVDKAKENISDNWNAQEFYVVQYWNIDKNDELILNGYDVDPAITWIIPDSQKILSHSGKNILLEEMVPTDSTHPASDEMIIDYYKIINSINRFTGMGRIEGNIWLSGKDIKSIKAPKISFIARGNCSDLKKKF
ncbi:MAG: hypothetical protein VW146_02480 [Gammaproteobacteria bacterium]